jgi:leucyl aminopeptidase
MHHLLTPDDGTAIVVHAVSAEGWRAELATFAPETVDFVAKSGFDGEAGRVALIPGGVSGLKAVLFGTGKAGSKDKDAFLAGKLATLLPPGVYRLHGDFGDPTLATLAFLLGAYRFERYKRTKKSEIVRLVPPSGVDAARVSLIADAVTEGRDLINTPANDLGPAEIEAAIRRVGEAFGAQVTSVVGEDLLKENFPMVHAVGRASTRAPRLIDLVWGDENHPKVTLVGKGVAFDTGGLNIKPDNSMLLMKKDMGGAAVALATARMIMAAHLPVRLRLVVAAVENSISGDAFRPGDVLQSRKGLTVEIGNTDAEGRLILGDALALADDEAPDLMFDFATLTGAARVALGPDLPPFYTDDATLAAEITEAGEAVNDPVWPMPLWKPYAKMLESKVADINHISSGGFAGSVTAALFLSRFVEKAKAWAHFDVFCWVPSPKNGRPEGGDVQAARLAFALIEKRYGTKTRSGIA